MENIFLRKIWLVFYKNNYCLDHFKVVFSTLVSVFLNKYSLTDVFFNRLMIITSFKFSTSI